MACGVRTILAIHGILSGMDVTILSRLRKMELLYAEITAVAVSPHQKGNGYGVVYVGTEPSALFSSEDGGKTWREHKEMKFLPSHRTWSFPPRPHTHHVRWITPDPEQSERIYVSIEFGAVLRSLDGGKTWEDKKFQGPLDVHTLLMHPKQSGSVVCGLRRRIVPGRLRLHGKP